MQTNQPTNRFQFSGSKPNRPIPGMKLAYGSQAQQRPAQTQTRQPQPTPKASDNQSLLSRLKERFFNLVTEEATSNERPIGISRLSNTTFQASPNRDATSFFKNSQPIQDYRFNQLVDPRRNSLQR